MNEPPSLLRNDVTAANHWLKVKLIGVKSNRSAIGARVTARYGGKVQAQEVLSQSTYLSVNDSRLHFGLGAANVRGYRDPMAARAHRAIGEGRGGPVDLGERGLGNLAGRAVRTPETMRYTTACFRALLAIACASLAMAQKPAVESRMETGGAGEAGSGGETTARCDQGGPA